MENVKIVISDCSWGNIDVERRYLPPQAQVEGHQIADEETLIEVCRDADAVLAEYAPFTRQVIERLERCRVIGQTAIGYDNIDLDAAREKGIRVTNVPGYCAGEVADHTMALMLACLRGVVEGDRQIRQGRWDLSALPPLHRLAGRTVGLLGFGDIARAVARRAAAFEMRVLVWSRRMTPERAAANGVAYAPLEQLLAEADVLSCHLPLSAQTRHFLNAERLGQCKRGVVLINTSRGALVDEGALVQMLQSGQVAAAGLDVLEHEPPAFDQALFAQQHVIITPHSGFYSEEALEEVRRRSAQNVAAVLAGQPERASVVI